MIRDRTSSNGVATQASVASSAEKTPRGVARRALDRLLSARSRGLTLIPVLVVVVVVGSLLNPSFFSKANIVTNILQQSAVLSVVVIAESMILISGRFDLTVESTVGLAPMIGAWLISPVAAGGLGLSINPYLVILIILSIGVAIGIVTGFFVVKLNLNAFIITLALLLLLRGLAMGITSGNSLGDLPSELTYIGSAEWLGVPVSVYLFLFLFIVADLFMKYHKTGRAIYAIGGNTEAARATGIMVDRISWSLYIFAGFLAAVAGIMLSGRIASVTAAQGKNLIFGVLAAAVIGGVSLNGGRGRMSGALVGVLLLATITNVLTWAQVPSFWINASYGGIIIGALVLSKRRGSDEEGRVVRTHEKTDGCVRSCDE
jgi:ribose/xylose/arabinose/galactoside ABC-type transport system permease subunit